MSTFKMDNGALLQLLRGPQGPVANRMKEVATEITGVAKVLCPRKTRELTKSIGWVIQQESVGLVAYVGTNKSYAIYVHQGTKAHRIQAKEKRALAFVWAGAPAGKQGKVVRKSVYHPGFKGNPFLTNAAKQVLGAQNVRS